MNFTQLKQVLSYLPPDRLVESNWHRHSNGNGWVENSARVDNSAFIGEDALVFGKAQVYGNAWVYGDALVSGRTWVFGDAKIFGNARVFENAQVFENAWVCGNACVYGNAQVYENALVYGNAQVSENARVYGNAWVYGNAQVYGDAWVQYSLTTDFLNKTAGIAATLNIYPDVNNWYLFYKRVNRQSETVFVSEYNPSFIYILGKRVEAKNPNPDTFQGCGAGLHVSHPTYWKSGDTLLQVAVYSDDIISWMEGKIRCRALVPVRVIE